MANYYKLSNGATVEYVCEASLSRILSAMFSITHTTVSVEKISMEEYLDRKAQEWMDSADPIFVQGMTTKSGLPVICVKFAPDAEDMNASCHYVVLDNGRKRLMMTYQKYLYEGEI